MNSLVWAVVLVTLLLDQLSKFLVSSCLGPQGSREIIRNVFYLTVVRNSGAAFGIFKDQTIFFIAVSVLAVAAILLYIRSRARMSFMRNTALALVLGGALGNLIDRLRFGYVIDFLDFRIWPVFNIADSAITIGVLLLAVSLFRK